MSRESTNTNTPLKKARHRHGLTLKDVVQVVGTTVGHLSRIENGRVVPRRELAAKLATLFSPSINELHLFYPERYGNWPESSTTVTP